ncbi:bifunctional alpha/beta hydrolase/class I SAM-dependent methyltransferase [Phytopseudomonas dryadis]|uniref:bifunctional alpha/beta hydrolase/class I SAM-dependent methyltransferase n=1 Tax=Pseudomonadaceae TaxID=135621 RepID=UPI001F61C03F|nr:MULTISPECIES: bifunctional alpha/beta hydrolase/class I SAM-dependent methyltransferase [Pseudomonas]
MRDVGTHSFTTHDGVELFYRHWVAAEATAATPRRAIVMFHRGHEHGGRMAHLVDELQLGDFDFFAWDARGHGESPGERGDSPSFATSVRDVQTFIDHIAAAHGIATQDMVVLAQSVGAVIVSTWAHDYAPKIRALVLASPAFKVKLYVPFARPGLKLMRAWRGNFFVNSYVKAKFLSHDPQRIASFDDDPLITRAISVNMLLGLYEAAERVVADAQAIQIPTQLLISGADFVVHRKPQQLFFERLGSLRKEQHILPGFFHDTLGERDRGHALARIRRFVLHSFSEPLDRPSLLDADRLGATCAEAETLAAPLPKNSPRDLYWRATRAGLKLGSGLSAGVKLGFDTGFDSGSTLDYVYRNTPTGSSPVGRLIDRNYLNSIGWRGIRQRKVHAEELLRLAMGYLREQGRAVRIVDIAAGHGRYILEALEQGADKPDSILLRDYSDINVRDGAALIEQKGLGDIARFVKGDAFDKADLAALDLSRPLQNVGEAADARQKEAKERSLQVVNEHLEPVFNEAAATQVVLQQPAKPTLAVVSGLYELFGSNQMVGDSLAGLAEAVEEGGYLVYTGQPWHPQLELIARALTSHRDGQPWVMRRRSQAEMDQLVEAAGFRKLTQRIDEWGIFSVSLAQRVS